LGLLACVCVRLSHARRVPAVNLIYRCFSTPHGSRSLALSPTMPSLFRGRALNGAWLFLFALKSSEKVTSWTWPPQRLQPSAVKALHRPASGGPLHLRLIPKTNKRNPRISSRPSRRPLQNCPPRRRVDDSTAIRPSSANRAAQGGLGQRGHAVNQAGFDFRIRTSSMKAHRVLRPPWTLCKRNRGAESHQSIAPVPAHEGERAAACRPARPTQPLMPSRASSAPGGQHTEVHRAIPKNFLRRRQRVDLAPLRSEHLVQYDIEPLHLLRRQVR